MKKNNILTVFLAGTIVFLSACSTTAGATKVQNLLTNALPPHYTGDAEVTHFNPYFDFDIKVGGLSQDANGLWTWKSLEYIRHDRFTHGGVTLTPSSPVTTSTAPP